MKSFVFDLECERWRYQWMGNRFHIFVFVCETSPTFYSNCWNEKWMAVRTPKNNGKKFIVIRRRFFSKEMFWTKKRSLRNFFSFSNFFFYKIQFLGLRYLYTHLPLLSLSYSYPSPHLIFFVWEVFFKMIKCFPWTTHRVYQPKYDWLLVYIIIIITLYAVEDYES